MIEEGFSLKDSRLDFVSAAPENGLLSTVTLPIRFLYSVSSDLSFIAKWFKYKSGDSASNET